VLLQSNTYPAFRGFNTGKASVYFGSNIAFESATMLPSTNYRGLRVRSWNGFNTGIDLSSTSDSVSRGAILADSGARYILDPDWTHGVYINNNSNSWIAYSDERMKDNVVDITQAEAEKLYLTAPVTFNYIASPTISQYGFIAQEMETVYPNIVNSENLTGMKGIQETKLLPMIVKLLQIHNDRITALEP
jgi:hypothetical protein